jgi:hypothetical protein
MTNPSASANKALRSEIICEKNSSSGATTGPAIFRRPIIPLDVGPQRRHGGNSRRAALRAGVPEPLRPARIGVVPAHARSWRSSRPCHRSCRCNETQGCAGSDSAARRPPVPAGPCPAHAAAAVAGTHHGTAANDGPARDVTARTDNRGPAHGASTSYGDASTSRADLDDRAVLPELLQERTAGSGHESQRRRSRDRQTGQTNDGRAGHAAESLRCAATLTNESHHCRLHFQPFHVCPSRH